MILTLTSSLVARSNSGDSYIENSRYMYIVPFFLLEGVGTIFNNEYDALGM